MEGFLAEGAFALGPEDWADPGRGSLRTQGYDQEGQGEVMRGWR